MTFKCMQQNFASIHLLYMEAIEFRSSFQTNKNDIVFRNQYKIALEHTRAKVSPVEMMINIFLLVSHPLVLIQHQIIFKQPLARCSSQCIWFSPFSPGLCIKHDFVAKHTEHASMMVQQ